MEYSQRILIVEDQREVSKLLHSALLSLERDLELITVLSGEEAILETRRKRVDLLVVDYRLPGINGLELFYKMKTLLPSVKMILITGVSDQFVRDEIAGVNPYAYFYKPVPISDFLDAVVRALGENDGRGSQIPTEKPEVKEEIIDLAVLLKDLKQKVNTKAIVLINNQGRILASSGDLPQLEEGNPLIEALVAILASANKVSQLKSHKGYPNYHIFRSEDVDLLFTPLNHSHGLLLAGSQLDAEEVMVENIHHILGTRQSIEDYLIRSQESTMIASTPPMEAGISNKMDLEVEMAPIMVKLKEKVSTDELDAFWDEAVEDNTLLPLHADDLSYDQARKLGLTPGDE